MGSLVDDRKKAPIKDVFNWDKQEKPRVKLISRKLDQAAVYFGFRGIKLSHDLRYALELTNIILGDGWLSRLMKEVREERGWAYSVRSGIDQYIDVGDVMIGAGLPKNKLKEAVKLIVEICTGLSGGNGWEIKEEEMKIAKDTFRGRLSLSFDIPEEVLGSALEDLMFEGKIHTPDEILKKIDGVSLEEIKKVSEMIFREENMSVAVVGDYKDLFGVIG